MAPTTSPTTTTTTSAQPTIRSSSAKTLVPTNAKNPDDQSGLLLLPYVTDFTASSRNRTLLLMRLSLATYPTCQDRYDYNDKIKYSAFSCGYGTDVLSPLWQAGQSIYGSHITNLVQEQAAAQDLQESNRRMFYHSLSTTDSVLDSPPRIQSHDYYGAQTEWSFVTLPTSYTTAVYEVGVVAVCWTLHAPYNTTIVAFRGTFSPGDFSNLENWIMDYVLERSSARMQQAWTQDAGLLWTPAMQQRYNTYSDQFAKLELRTAETYFFGQEEPLKEDIPQFSNYYPQNSADKNRESFAQRLVNAVNANATLAEALRVDSSQDGEGPESNFTNQEALKTGYWTLTRYLVRQVAQQAMERNYTLLFTGHSQGGTRAQLASMYLHQRTGMAHPAVTFGATGSACMSRLLWYQSSSDSSLRSDTTTNNLVNGGGVNPFLPQNQLLEYVHPLDPWGNAMLGRDNGGHVCFWGTSTALQHEEGLNEETEEEEEEAENNTSFESHQVTKDAAYTYCSRIYGYRGPLLMAANVDAPLGHSSLNAAKIRQDFQRCRYVTHSAEAILLAFLQGESDAVIVDDNDDSPSMGGNDTTKQTTASPFLLLRPDGTTDGTCRPVLVIPKDDPLQLCPIGGISKKEETLAGEMILVIVVVLLSCLCIIGRLCWCCCRGARLRRQLRKQRILVQQHEDNDGHDDNDHDGNEDRGGYRDHENVRHDNLDDFDEVPWDRTVPEQQPRATEKQTSAIEMAVMT